MVGKMVGKCGLYPLGKMQSCKTDLIDFIFRCWNIVLYLECRATELHFPVRAYIWCTDRLCVILEIRWWRWLQWEIVTFTICSTNVLKAFLCSSDIRRKHWCMRPYHFYGVTFICGSFWFAFNCIDGLVFGDNEPGVFVWFLQWFI